MIGEFFSLLGFGLGMICFLISIKIGIDKYFSSAEEKDWFDLLGYLLFYPFCVGIIIWLLLISCGL